MEALAAALEGDFESDDAMTAVVEQLDRVRSTCTTTEAAAAVADALGVARLCDATIAFGHRAGRYQRPACPGIGAGCSDISLLLAMTSSARLLRNLCIAGPAVQRSVAGTERSAAASESAEGAALDGPAPATVLGAADRVIRNPFLAEGAGAAFAAAAAGAVRALLQCASNAVAGDDASRAAAWPVAKSIAAAALSLPHGGVRDAQLDAVACGLLHTCACQSAADEGGSGRLVEVLSSPALLASVMAASSPVRGQDQLPPCAHWALLLVGRAVEEGCVHHAVSAFGQAAFAGSRTGAATAGEAATAAAEADAACSGLEPETLPDRDAISSLLMLLRLTRDTSLLSETESSASASADRAGPDLTLHPADVDAVAGVCASSLSGFLELSASAMAHVAAALSPGAEVPRSDGGGDSGATARAIVACLCAEAALAALDLLGDALTAMHRRIDNGASPAPWTDAALGAGLKAALECSAAALTVLPEPVRASPAAATAAEQCGLLVALLGQTRMERGIARPVVREYSLLAVRNAVQCSAEARSFVEALKPQGVSNPEAMRAMGIKAEVDATTGSVTVGLDAAKDGGGQRWRTRAKEPAPSPTDGSGQAAAAAAGAGGPSPAATAAAEAAIRRAVDDGEIQM
ncbi:hypothetical protein FNF29_01319 [Cafeteria roenbergensis]|uniref:Ataxin-10 domain-containing protein n=1 Tax=Cafeteria roenbergensis TaxID=33653 RepID=A0A5A8CUQ1_CAFRO|nr:hypothetical protein FNF29_01319 [Cafeteria roenbergensis]|eukprot:KAA0155900.1 hypothetical protein FNF29_01319 [Cafeteria roenbergensis]